MITNFARRGYRTVALMPGMRQAWPEGAFYHFDQIYGRDLLDTAGLSSGGGASRISTPSRRSTRSNEIV